jgi:acetyl-CoA carboxylase biotin carboxyl carrier protein
MVHRIKALAEALEGSAVGELDLTESGTRIVIRRRFDPPLLMPVYGNGAVRGGRAVRGRGAESAPAPAPDPTVAVRAPLTGVFYAAPSPTSAPYAQVGDTIQAGQTICIVEAMKVFNEIQSEVSGTVTAILAQPGKLVHKGEALIRVQPI